MTKTKFNQERWGHAAVMAQNACNPLGLLNSIVECLKEWRNSDEWNGTDDDKKCIPLRMMMWQVNYLLNLNTGIAHSFNYPTGEDGWGADYNLMKRWADIKD
jgi:hypothetical protein